MTVHVVTKGKRTFKVDITVDSNGPPAYKFLALETTDPQRPSVVGDGCAFSRWGARFGARLAIRRALKGGEHWDVTAEEA